jgi:AmmeMemoRadiSam system protein B
MEREPAVAGRFYTRDPGALAAEVAGLLAGPAPLPREALGILSPHAGYVFSGAVAGATWARVRVPPRVVLLCPNHTGRGARVALWPGGSWRTPLGAVPVDPTLTADLLATGLCAADRAAHVLEHALEVQLPFLQVRRPDAAVAALCLGPLDFERCRALGLALAEVAGHHGALVVASSDMSHYLPAEVARRKDRLALDRLLALDARGLHEVVEREDISLCGFVPATVMLVAAVARGATGAELTGYRTSGDVTGDQRSVVAYAGAIVA